MRDSNSRPLGPKPSALAIWANSRNFTSFLEWWAWVDSNHRPHPYQRCALTAWATRPFFSHTHHFSGAKRQNRTADTRLFRPLLYHWATLAQKEQVSLYEFEHKMQEKNQNSSKSRPNKAKIPTKIWFSSLF